MRIVYDEDYDYYENLMCKIKMIGLAYARLNLCYYSGIGRSNGKHPTRHELAYNPRRR